jgi:hypothetical protein
MTNKWLVKLNKKVNKLNRKFAKHLAKLQRFSKEEWMKRVLAK